MEFDGDTVQLRKHTEFNPIKRRKIVTNRFLAKEFGTTEHLIGKKAKEFGYNPYDARSLIAFILHLGKEMS